MKIKIENIDHEVALVRLCALQGVDASGRQEYFITEKHMLSKGSFVVLEMNEAQEITIENLGLT